MIFGATRIKLLCLLLAVFMALPAPAYAHVKWFCSTVDLTLPPVALLGVASPLFLACAAAFSAMVLVGFRADSWVGRRWPGWVSAGPRLAAAEEQLIRLAAGAYFLLLWDKGAVVLWARGDAILTPELMASSGWMTLLHGAMAFLVIWRRTCILAAVGITVLFGFGVMRFGAFHMTDYVYFLGLAAYLACTSIGTPRALAARVPLLVAGLAFSLMWTAIEKFLYPQWTLAIVAEHPDLAWGLAPAAIVVIAGFVEFTLAFYLISGRGLLRLGAAAFMAIFVSAIPEFGHLDAVGHLPIVAILGLVCMHGASPLQNAVRRRATRGRGGVAADAAGVAVLYLTALTAMFALYYGLHAVSYR